MNKYISTIVIAAMAFGVCGQSAAELVKTNIVFILADDLGMQDVGFMGSQYFEMPNLDALAEQSLVFNQAYMYPTCSPSRAAILTGKQSFRTGCYTVPVLEKGNSKDNIFSKWTVDAEHPVYAKSLNAVGYKLIHLGKWHIVGPNPEGETALPLKKKLSQPKNGDLSWLDAHRTPEIQQYYLTGRGFHENVGGTWWGDPARGYVKGYNASSGGYLAPFKNPFITDKEDDEWLTDRLTSDAIDFMERLNRWTPMDPAMVHLQYLRADCALWMDHPKAAEYLQQFEQVLPPYNAANCAHEARWMLDATPELRDRLLPLARKAVEKEPENADFLRTLGEALYHTEDREHAEVILLRAFDLSIATSDLHDPKAGEVMRLLIELYEAWGKPEKAKEWRAKLLQT